MDKAMTVRFDEKRMKELEEMIGTGWSKWKKSQLLRVAVAFMFECFKTIPKQKNEYYNDIPNKLNLKFNTKLSTSRWNW